MDYIEKSLEDFTTGATVSFHQIVRYSVDYSISTIDVTIASYFSAKAKKKGRQALSYNIVTIDNISEKGFLDNNATVDNWILQQLISASNDTTDEEVFSISTLKDGVIKKEVA